MDRIDHRVVYLASVSTMYRPLLEAGQVRERRAKAAHPARKKPELTATGPDEVWSWDITSWRARSGACTTTCTFGTPYRRWRQW